MTGRYGPQTGQVEALLARARRLSPIETKILAATRDDPLYGLGLGVALLVSILNGRYAAWTAVQRDPFDGVPSDARPVARLAASALVVRDLAPGWCYRYLTHWWRKIIGPIHPDDPELTATTQEQDTP